MENWSEYYAARHITASEAVQKIKSGDLVFIPHACGTPLTLVEAMIENREAYRDVRPMHYTPRVAAEYCQPDMAPYFHHMALSAGKSSRQAIADGRADYIPGHFSTCGRLFETTLTPDVAFVHVSPPDKHGYCSLGVSVDAVKSAARCAKLVIAQVNRMMPRVLGDSFMRVSEIDYFVESDRPLPQVFGTVLSDEVREIGKNCAALVRDGATIQLGIGAIPDATALSLREKNDLGVHTEMLSDAIVDLYELGVINNSRKNIHRGKCVSSFIQGTQKLFDWVDDNPAVELYPVEYVNDPQVIAKNDYVVAINSCVEIDFSGQVCAESIGTTQISASGGQVDFVRGAAMSKGGISITAMTSTTGQGKISRIVPVLAEGAAVTTLRNDVMFVVTEYGVADLRGQTVRERARRLISIAHPDFREELGAAFEERFHEPYLQL